MLQRVQSLFLGVTGICMILMVFFPIWSKTDSEGSSMYLLFAIGEISRDLVSGQDTASYLPAGIIAGLALIAAGIAFFEIFQFRNRLLQIKIGALNSVIMGLSLGLAIYLVTQLDKEIMPGIPGVFHMGFYLPAVAMFSNVVANRFIKRDEKIVRDADRMR